MESAVNGLPVAGIPIIAPKPVPLSVPVAREWIATLLPDTTVRTVSPCMSGTAANIIVKSWSAPSLVGGLPGMNGLCSTKSSASISAAASRSCSLNTFWLNRSTRPLISSGVGTSLASRPGHRAQLHHHLGDVHLGPGLHDLAILQAVDRDPVRVHLMVVGGDPEPGQAALVGPSHAHMGDHHVVLTEYVEELVPAVREGLHGLLMGHLDPVQARWDLIGARRVRGEVRRDQAVQRIQVVRGPGMLQTTNDFHIGFAHGSPSGLVGATLRRP